MLLSVPLVCALLPQMLGGEQRASEGRAPTGKLCRDTQQHLGAAASSKILERLEAARWLLVTMGVPAVYLSATSTALQE